MAVDNVELEMFTFHCLREMQKKGTLCDLVLISNDWKEFKVHSLVVVAVSKSFYNLCTEQGSLKKLRLMNVSGDSLGLLIRFLYGENLSNIEDLKLLSQTLKKLGMKDLFQFIGTSLCHFGSPSSSGIHIDTNKVDLLKESKERNNEEPRVENQLNRPDQRRGGNSENLDCSNDPKTLTVMNNDGSLKPLGLFINEAHVKYNNAHQQTVGKTSVKETFQEQDETDKAMAIESLSPGQFESMNDSTSKNQQGMFYFDKKYALVFAKQSKSTDNENSFVKIQLPNKSPHEENGVKTQNTNLSPTRKSLNKKVLPAEKLETLPYINPSKTRNVISIKPSKSTQELLLVSNCLSGLPVPQTINQETDERKGKMTDGQISKRQIAQPQPKSETQKSKSASDITKLKGLCKPAVVSLSRIPDVKPGQRFKVQNNGSVIRHDGHCVLAPTSRKRKGLFEDKESQTKFPREVDMDEEEMLIIDLKKEGALSPDVTSRRSLVVDKDPSNRSRYSSKWKVSNKQDGTSEIDAAELSYEKILHNIKTEPKSFDDLNVTYCHNEQPNSQRKQGTLDASQKSIKTEHGHEQTLIHDKVLFAQSNYDGKQRKQSKQDSYMKENPSTVQSSTMKGSTVQSAVMTDTQSSSVQSSTKNPSSSTLPIMIQLPDGNITTVMFPQNLITTNPAEQKKHQSRSRIHPDVSNVASPLQFNNFNSRRALPVQIQLPDGKSTTVMVPKQLTEGIPYDSSVIPVSSNPSTQSSPTGLGASAIQQNTSQNVIYQTAKVPMMSSAQISSKVSTKLSTWTRSGSPSVPQDAFPKMIFQNPASKLSQNNISKPGPGDVSGNVSTSSSVPQSTFLRMIMQNSNIPVVSPVHETKSSLTDNSFKQSTSTASGSQMIPNSSQKMAFQTANFPVVSPIQITDPTSVSNNMNNQIILIQPPTSSQKTLVTNPLQTVVSGSQIVKNDVMKKQSAKQIPVKPLQLPIVNQAQVLQPQFPALYPGQPIFLQQNQPVPASAGFVNSASQLSQPTFWQLPQLPTPSNRPQMRFIQTKDGGPGLGQTVHLSKDFVLSSGQPGVPQPVQIFNNACVKQAGPARFPMDGFKRIVRNSKPTSVSSQSKSGKPDWKLK